MLIENGIKISMDGKGRWADNAYIERFWRTIKWEAVHLHSFDSIAQAKEVIANYIRFYNQVRPHQSLNYKTPDEIYNRFSTQKKQSEIVQEIYNLKPDEGEVDSKIQAKIMS